MAIIWLVPSFFGDVRVVSISPKACKVLVEQATDQELAALIELHKVALKKKWIDPASKNFGAVTELQAPIEKISKLIAKALKPGKKLVSAVKFGNGKMEEVTEATFKVSPSSKAVATTVAAPVRGCPAPDFSPARLRAREVLTAFMNADQRADFERHNRFIAIGATTGHRYMITSRHAKDQLARYRRTLYDLDDRKPLCVHAWDIPAEEEMHTIHILTQMPGWERYLRTIRE